MSVKVKITGDSKFDKRVNLRLSGLHKAFTSLYEEVIVTVAIKKFMKQNFYRHRGSISE